MGVEARIVVCAPAEDEARLAAAAAFARIEALDAALSDYRADSELEGLGHVAGGPPVAVSEDLWRVLELAQGFAEASDGAFDVTIGPLSRCWREARAAGALPEPAALAEARARVGWRKLHLDRDTRTAALAPGVRLDLGAIGKGYACDRALEILAQRGFPSALVEIGGDLALGAPPPGESGWSVLSEGPSGTKATRLVLAHCGVASSGDREQHLDAGGRRYSHVVDPRTGAALTHGLGFTVVASDGASADALATAASVLGRHAGRELVARYPGTRLVVDDPRAVALFDGQTLAGWTTRGGRYDGDAVWSVEDGCITGRTGEGDAGGLLYTARPYTSFVLELETQMSWPFDSGVFVRMVPPERDLKGAQVTLDHRSDGEIGAIYADGFLLHNEDGARLFRRGEWNHVEVRCTGFDMHIEAWINGVLAADYRMPDDAPGYAPSGLIGVQVHGGGVAPEGSWVRFRDVAIRELPVFGEELFANDARGLLEPTPDAREQGWRTLLGSSGLDGWEIVGPQDGYAVQGGVLAIPATETAGHLQTAEDYRDFRLHLDFEIARMANSGIFLRASRGGGNPAYSGCEVQILDDFDWEAVTGDELEDWQLTGSLYGSVAPSVHPLRPPGEWNTYEILCRGSRLAVALNGQTLYDVDTHAVPAKPPFAERAREGFIGLQRYGSPHAAGEFSVRFRNLFVQRL